MEYYFSGTIERVIFENQSSFFRILLLDINDTDAEDYDDFEIIVTGTMADIVEGEDYTFWGELVHHPKYGQQLQMNRYERAKPTSKGLVKYFSSILKGSDSKRPKRSSISMVRIPLIKFCKHLKNWPLSPDFLKRIARPLSKNYSSTMVQNGSSPNLPTMASLIS